MSLFGTVCGHYLVTGYVNSLGASQKLRHLPDAWLTLRGVGSVHNPDCSRGQCPLCSHHATGAIAAIVEEGEHGSIAGADRLPWSGEVIGIDATREFGGYAKAVAGGWEACNKYDDSAVPDADRVLDEATRVQNGRKFVLPMTARP